MSGACLADKSAILICLDNRNNIEEHVRRIIEAGVGEWTEISDMKVVRTSCHAKIFYVGARLEISRTVVVQNVVAPAW